MDVAAVRTGLANAAAVVTYVDPGGITRTLRAVPYLADSIQPPTWVSGEVEIEYDLTFGRGLDVVLVKGRLYTGRGDDLSGQALLDGFLKGSGAGSVKAALEADKTLGGVCKQLHVERVSGYGLYQVAGIDYYGAKFDVKVWGNG